MKFTSEDLMKSMGLKVGDRVRIGIKELEKYTFLVDDEGDLSIVNEDYHMYYPITFLIDKEFEILQTKHVGDKKCKDCDCRTCQLKFLCENGLDFICDDNKTLYKILEKSGIEDSDKEIYNLLKKRLDKEVLENE